MFTDIRLTRAVMTAEGLRLVAYWDPTGKVWTCGWGHTGPDVTKDTVCTRAQAIDWLNEDLDRAERYAVFLSEWPSLDTPARRNAIVECVFNLGIHNWTDEFPKTRRALQAKDWATAAANLRASPLWESQVGAERILRLSLLISAGIYPESSSSPSPASPSPPAPSGPNS